MPERILCPKCEKSGLTRVEQVITGTQMFLSYYCGGCEHTWRVAGAVPTLGVAPLDRTRGRPPAPKRRPR